MDKLKDLYQTYWTEQDVKLKASVIFLGSFVTLSYVGSKYLMNKPKIYKPLLSIKEVIKGEIWQREYCIEIMKIINYAKCTVIKLSNNKYLIHSPSPCDDIWDDFFKDKEIEYILGPSNFHWLHINEWKTRYPDSKVILAPGIALKDKNLSNNDIYSIIHDNNDVLRSDFDYTLLRGFAATVELLLYHKNTKSLIITDAILNWDINKDKDVYNKMNRFGYVMNYLTGYLEEPKPSMGFTNGLKSKKLAKESFDNVFKWDINNIILAHGGNFINKTDKECKDICKKCWKMFI